MLTANLELWFQCTGFAYPSYFTKLVVRISGSHEIAISVPNCVEDDNEEIVEIWIIFRIDLFHVSFLNVMDIILTFLGVTCSISCIKLYPIKNFCNCILYLIKIVFVYFILFIFRQQQGTSSSSEQTGNTQETNQSQETNNSNSQDLPSSKPVPKPSACSVAENYVGGGNRQGSGQEQYENDDQVTEEAMLEAAIKLSMQSSW